MGQTRRRVVIKRYGLGCRRQPTQARAAKRRRQVVLGFGSKQVPCKKSAKGREGCGVHDTSAGPCAIVGLTPEIHAIHYLHLYGLCVVFQIQKHSTWSVELIT